MKKRGQATPASVATLLALGFSGSASADESQFYGLLRECDLTANLLVSTVISFNAQQAWQLSQHLVDSSG